jgi:hypothetical protein
VGGIASIELRIEDVAGQLLDREAVVYLEAVSGLLFIFGGQLVMWSLFGRNARVGVC